MSQHNLNKDIPIKKLREAVLGRDWPTFSRFRYLIGDLGAVCIIESLNLEGYALGDMPTDFLCFKHCKMKNVSFNGKRFFPMSLWNCNAQNIDLRNTNGMLFALNSDLRGAKFDETTQLVVNNSDVPSAFKNCKLDDEFRKFLTAQGVIFDFPSHYSIESYAFGEK